MILKPDLLLNANGDLAIVNGDLQLTNGTQTLEQRIRRALLTFKGEWFLDEDIGIPYWEEILGQKDSIDAIKDVFIDAILKIEGVQELKDLKIKLNNEERGLEMNFTILDVDNNLIEIEI
jgi:hypothetical protein